MKMNKILHVILSKTKDPVDTTGFFTSFRMTLFCCILLLTACHSLQKPNFHPLIQSQPFVIGLTPDPNHFLEKIESIELSFSTLIDPASLHEKSILILQDEIDPNQISSMDLIEKNLNTGKFSQVTGTLKIAQDPRKVTWTPSLPLQYENYTVVVTSKLQGIGKVPFNQKPGEKVSPFIAVFKLPKKQESPPNESPPLPPPVSKKRPTTLVIHEILYDALESDTDGNEFIELHGTPNAEIEGYQLILVNGTDGKVMKIITLPENSQIRGNGIFLIADAQTGKPSQSNIEGADLIDNFDPQNGPDALQLLDDQGRLIDPLTYGTGAVLIATNGFLMGEGDPASDVEEGHSLSRKDGIDTNMNQVDFIELEIPTPGVL